MLQPAVHGNGNYWIRFRGLLLGMRLSILRSGEADSFRDPGEATLGNMTAWLAEKGRSAK